MSIRFISSDLIVYFFLFRKFNPSITNVYRIKDGNYSIIWIDDFKQLLPNDTYFLISEFFTNYPIHKFQVEIRLDFEGKEKSTPFNFERKPVKVGRKC